MTVNTGIERGDKKNNNVTTYEGRGNSHGEFRENFFAAIISSLNI